MESILLPVTVRIGAHVMTEFECNSYNYGPMLIGLFTYAIPCATWTYRNHSVA